MTIVSAVNEIWKFRERYIFYAAIYVITWLFFDLSI